MRLDYWFMLVIFLRYTKLQNTSVLRVVAETRPHGGRGAIEMQRQKHGGGGEGIKVGVILEQELSFVTA